MTLPPLPSLGVGVMWFPGLAHLYDELDAELDFYEFEPAVSALRAGDHARPSGRPQPRARPPGGKPTVVHSVTCALGGSAPPDLAELRAVREVAREVDSPWVSDHLSIDRLPEPGGGLVDAGFLLPPEQTEESATRAAAHVRRFRDVVSRPVAFETGVNYLRPRPGDLPDGEFFALVAEMADCFVLCDLHNLWCNERNGRDRVLDVVASLPPERVCELHLAGGQLRDGYLLDAHSDLVDDALVELAVDVASSLPALRAVTFELMPDYAMVRGIDVDRLRDQVVQLRRVWDGRGSRLARREETAHSVVVRAGERGGSTWEHQWYDALRTEPTATAGTVGVAADPGAAVYRDLVDTMRLGNIVTALPLTYRLLVSRLGLDESDRVCRRYLAARPPRQWAYEEGADFAAFVASEVSVPHLTAVADFEIAAQEVTLSGTATTVAFDCEPTELLAALRRGQRPPEPVAGSYVVRVEP